MQIGNFELELVYRDVITQAVKACGLEPKRVDKHNEGKLLKSEIVTFIESSDIIVADLTNERPNCYLEVGYTMGLNKYSNLILTAREDHNKDSPNFKKGGPKIHFDLSGYDILFWEPDKHGEFKEKLEREIRRRLSVIQSNSSTFDSHLYSERISEHSEKLISQVLKLWFKSQLRPHMTTSNLSIQTSLHKTYYKPSNNSRIENYANIYNLDENKRAQIFEHFQSVDYKDIWNNWTKLETLSNDYLTKNIEICTKIEKEFIKNKPIEFDLSGNRSFYNLSNTVEGIYLSAKNLASDIRYINLFKKYPTEINGFKVSSSSQIYAESPNGKLIDRFIKAVNEIVYDKKLINQLKVLDGQYNEISALTSKFKQQLKDISDDFEDGYINLKGTCSRCKGWVE